jgi:hypothetical protein
MPDPENTRRQADLYWKQFAQPKSAAICIRLSRNRLARSVRTVELIKVFGSSGAIAGWVVWKDWPMLWSGIIAAAQLLDATKHVFPFARLHKAAGEMTVALELLCIDAEAEWAEIESANMPDTAITERRKRLAKLRVETEYKFFPEGFEPSETMKRKARSDAHAYLTANYGQGVWTTQAAASQIYP